MKCFTRRFSAFSSFALLALAAYSSVLPAAPARSAVDIERDRQSILAMAGQYGVDFHFEETVALRPDYQRHEPKDEAGEEVVLVVENTPRRVSLQHILVTKEGHVVKHWRQDWEYEQTQLWRYTGDQVWERRTLKPAEARGKWVQTVWQVDDSPRYAGIGAWEYGNGIATWTSDLSWRPLPRREHTTRADYNVLVSVNRHTITPRGWSHEQDSTKLDTHAPEGQQELVRESAVNTYERLPNYNFKPGIDYWAATSPFWAQVRTAWATELAKHERLSLQSKEQEGKLLMELLTLAEKYKDEPATQAAAVASIQPTIDRYLRYPQAGRVAGEVNNAGKGG